jgi:anti-sigma regulatory factor (Ser/Thr protein kinase)
VEQPVPPVQLSHDALVYGSDEEFTGVLVPFIREGLDQDQPVTAAVTGRNIALLRDALGADADAVTFIDRDGWYLRPASTIAGWLGVLAKATAAGRESLRLIGEVGFGPAGRHRVWTRYEAAVNRVFAAAPALIICPYDTRALPAGVIADARRTHPTVRDPARHGSDAYVAAEDFLRAVPEPVPVMSGPPSLQLMIDGDVAAARHAVAGHLAAAGRAGWDRLDDLLLAVTELAANAVRHGRGRRELRLWITGEAVVGEVTDEGGGPGDPLLGYRPPAPQVLGGQGLWLVRQLCDQLSLDTGGGKTRARFAMDTSRPGARVA